MSVTTMDRPAAPATAGKAGNALPQREAGNGRAAAALGRVMHGAELDPQRTANQMRLLGAYLSTMANLAFGNGSARTPDLQLDGAKLGMVLEDLAIRCDAEADQVEKLCAVFHELQAEVQG